MAAWRTLIGERALVADSCRRVIQRQALKAELSELNERRVNLNSEINSYNSDVLRLRELGVQIDELNKSLDSLEGAK